MKGETVEGVETGEAVDGEESGADSGDGEQGPFKGRVYHRSGRKSVRKVCEMRRGGCAGG